MHGNKPMKERIDYTPTPAERKNGWTEERLRRFHEETNMYLEDRFFGEKKPQVQTLNVKQYNPHSW